MDDWNKEQLRALRKCYKLLMRQKADLANDAKAENKDVPTKFNDRIVEVTSDSLPQNAEEMETVS